MTVMDLQEQGLPTMGCAAALRPRFFRYNPGFAITTASQPNGTMRRSDKLPRHLFPCRDSSAAIVFKMPPFQIAGPAR
jgi:hypothetical protein